ncbi:MAG: PAS domain S-box protein [Opitutaceae bacterium]|nr:PAS domain S-box protein [Opitutaceae bacterium]
MMSPAVSDPSPVRLDRRWLLAVLALAALYFASARLGLQLAMPGGHVAPLWPAAGVALAVIYLRGWRLWPGIWLGSCATNFWDFSERALGLPAALGVAALLALGASAAALAGAALLQRFLHGRNPLERLRDVGGFMALGGLAGCLPSATLGVAALGLTGIVPRAGFGTTWLTWWLGDVTGVFIVAPLLLAWMGSRPKTTPPNRLELAACFLALAGAGIWVFLANETGRPLAFLAVPPLVWAAARFGPRGAATALGLLALLAVWGTIHRAGPFNAVPRDDALLLLELFLAAITLTALGIAAIVAERTRAQLAQRQALGDLEARVAERTATLAQSEAQARAHLAEAQRARAALLSILEDERSAETRLRASEARFRAIFEQAPLGIAEGEIETGRFVAVNQRYADIVGYTRGELLTLNFKDYTHPDDLPANMAEFRRLATGQIKGFHLEKRYRRKDGSIVWANLTVVNLETEGHPSRHALVVIDDITERKRAEAAIRASEERLRIVTDNARVGLVIVDRERRYVYANATYARIFGVAADQIVGLRVADLLEREYEMQVRPRLDRAFQGERVAFELSRKVAGKEFFLSVRYQPMESEGEVTAVVAVVVDISDLINAERARAQSEARYRTLFECAPDGILITDTQGTVLAANPSLCRMLGCTREELIGQKPDRIVASAEIARVETALKEIADGAEHRREWRFRRKDDSTFPADVIATMMPDGSLLALTRDVTERKRAESALRDSAEQLRALAARVQAVREEERTRIAREIHDVLAQELTRLKIDLTWVAKRLVPPLEPTGQAAVAGRIGEALGQVDASISTVQRIATDLRPVILDSLGLLAAVEWMGEDFARRTGLVCHASVESGPAALERERATAIFRILQESLTNVARYAQASEVLVELSEAEGVVTLKVTDNGVGISRERAEDPRSIGLLGMKQRAHAFGGTVEITGRPGVGTTVVARLPSLPGGGP